MKKNLYKIISVVLAILLMSMQCSVFAESEAENLVIAYDRESGEVNISGSAPSAENSEEPVRLLILKPGTDTEALASGDVTFLQVGVHVDETALSDDKSYVFEKVTLPETLPAGDYIVIVAAGDEVFRDVLPFAAISQVLSMMDNVTESDTVKANIEKYNDVYGLKIGEESDYSGLSDEGKEFVLTNMCGKEYTDGEEIINTFDKYTQLYRIYEGPCGVVQEVIESHNELLGLDLSDYDNAGKSKVDICKDLAGNLYEDENELNAAFTDAVEANPAPSDDEDDSPSNSRGGSSGSVSMQVAVPKETEKPEKNEGQTEIFSDLGNHSWAKESVYELYLKGIINGKAEGVFAPNDSVTRAEAVKMIVLTLSELDSSASCSFSDVSEGSWMYPYVATAFEKGLVNGYSDGSYGVNDAVTREDFAAIIMRALLKAGVEIENIPEILFADDSDISGYAKEAVYKLKSAGIINGTGDNLFMPKAHTTRAEAAKILAALVD